MIVEKLFVEYLRKPDTHTHTVYPRMLPFPISFLNTEPVSEGARKRENNFSTQHRGRAGWLATDPLPEANEASILLLQKARKDRGADETLFAGFATFFAAFSLLQSSKPRSNQRQSPQARFGSPLACGWVLVVVPGQQPCSLFMIGRRWMG